MSVFPYLMKPEVNRFLTYSKYSKTLKGSSAKKRFSVFYLVLEIKLNNETSYQPHFIPKKSIKLGLLREGKKRRSNF